MLANLHIIRLPTQLGLVPTNNCGFLGLQCGFLPSLPSVSMFLSVGVILPLTLALFSSPLTPPPPSRPTLNFSRTVPVLFHESAEVPNSKEPSPLSFLLCLPLSISLRLRCGNGEMLTWLCARSALPGPPTYLPVSRPLRLVICWHAPWY